MRNDYEIKLNGTYIGLALFLIIYQILGSVYLYSPLLYGIFFCYMFFLLEESERTLNELDFRWYFSLFFLFFTDATYDFFVFSSWVAFCIFYYVFADWIKTNLKTGAILAVIFVFCAYILIFVVDRAFSYMSNEEAKTLNISYIISILIECLFAYILFRGKIQ